MESPTVYTPTSETDWDPHFNHAADITYGLICCSCFLVGTVGNLASFLYFKSKRKDISSVIYRMVTINDILISLAILPMGVSLWSSRRAGAWFGNEYGCGAWFYLWETAVAFSVFLVLCLSTTRTISLLKPFKRLKVRYLVLAVVTYLLLTLAVLIRANMLQGAEVIYFPWYIRCELYFTLQPDETILLTLEVFRILAYVAPVFVVTSSCIISAVLLTRRNEEMRQKELQQSRNSATITILLFALLYGVCNIPLVVNLVLLTYSGHTNNMEWYYNLHRFDTQNYYFSAMSNLLIAANSAANPILYFWRMPPLRGYTMAGARIVLRLNKGIGRGPNSTVIRRMKSMQSVQVGSSVRVLQNIQVAPKLPAVHRQRSKVELGGRHSNDKLLT